MRYICLSCGYSFKRNVDSAHQDCPQCNGDAWWEDSGYIKGTINTPVVPSWRKYETQMKSGDPHDQLKAADKFTAERDLATKTDPKMAKWERSRRASLQKQKGSWLKKELRNLKDKGL